MNKIEKILSGLEHCVQYNHCGDECPTCIYYKECATDGEPLMRDTLELLKGLLKAQEPVKPVPAIDDVGDWLCGNCYQSVVGEEELDASGFVPVKFNF